jgi:hypothetical protein
LSGRAIIDSVKPPRATLLASALAGLAGLSLLVSACGGSKSGHVAQLGSTPTQSGSNPSADSAEGNGAVAFSRCMRSNGVPNFPDPDSSGAIPKLELRRLGVSNSQLQSAQSACQHLLPRNDIEPSVMQCLSTGACPGPLLHEILTQGLQFARCMRSHGVPSWPDPSRYPDNGAPVFNLLHVHGFDPRSPQIEDKMNECQHVYSAGIRVGLARS